MAENTISYMFHPLANIFPLIEGRAYDELRADVLKNGVREPIWLYEGKILDGRNRYRAASSQGVAFEVREYEGDDAVGFVISLNLHRRHLNEAQRAAVAAKLANMTVGGDRKSDHSANLHNDSVSQSEAAKLLNVSTRSVAAAAKVVHEAAPELVQAMDEGRASVSAASALLSLPKEQQAEVARGEKKEIQKAAKVAKSKPVELAQPAGTEHVLYLINQMDLIARHLSRSGMTAEQMAEQFLSEVDPGNSAISDRLSVALPIMEAFGRIAAELETEEAV